MTSYLRMRANQLMTPTHRFIHPDGGRRLLLVGVMHTGDPGYFAALRAIIDHEVANPAVKSAHGALVRCEGGKTLPNDDATSAEQAVLDMMGQADALEAERSAAWGWTTQLAADGLDYPPGGHVVDFSNLEMIRRIGVDLIRARLEKKLAVLGDDSPEGLARFQLGVAFGLRLWAKVPMPVGGPVDRVAVGQRNAAALADLDTITDAEAVVMTWGARHLPGLIEGIRARGYRRTETRWHTVATIPTMRAALRGLSAAKAGVSTPAG